MSLTGTIRPFWKSTDVLTNPARHGIGITGVNINMMPLRSGSAKHDDKFTMHSKQDDWYVLNTALNASVADELKPITLITRRR